MSDFAERYVTLRDPLEAFDDAYFEVTGLLFAAAKNPDAPAWVCRHVVELCDEYAAVAEGVAEPIPDRGTDYIQAFSDAGRRARHAFREPDYLDERRDTPIGLMPGSVTVQHVVNELVTHAWDIAHATGAKLQISDDTIERVRASWSVFFETYGRPGFNFEPEKPAPEGASAIDRLAAYLGRDVQSGHSEGPVI